MSKADIASAKHRNGYNCCQAVACTFAEETGIDESILYKLGEGFGAGMGTTEGVCGAISGAAMIAGLVIVPVVSLVPPKPEKALVDFAFAGYDEQVTVSAKESLGRGK